MECWYYLKLMVLLFSWASWFVRRVFGLRLGSVGRPSIAGAYWMLQYLQSVAGAYCMLQYLQSAGRDGHVLNACCCRAIRLAAGWPWRRVFMLLGGWPSPVGHGGLLLCSRWVRCACVVWCGLLSSLYISRFRMDIWCVYVFLSNWSCVFARNQWRACKSIRQCMSTCPCVSLVYEACARDQSRPTGYASCVSLVYEASTRDESWPTGYACVTWCLAWFVRVFYGVHIFVHVMVGFLYET